MEAQQEQVEVVSLIKPFTSRYIGINKDLTVSYTDFEITKLQFSVPTTKHYDGIPDYDQIVITYEYTVANGKTVIDTLVLEGPITSSKSGIVESIGKEGENKGKLMGYSLGTGFDPNNKEHLAFIDVLKSIYIRCVKEIHSERVRQSAAGQRIGNAFMKKDTNFDDMLDPQNAWPSMGYILSYKKNGSSYITTTPPTFWTSLLRGNGTLFVRVPKKNEDGTYSATEEISREVLEISSFPIIKPFYKFVGININAAAKCKIKHALKSAIIGAMDSKSISLSVSQLESAKRMADNNDVEGISLDEQIAKMLPEAKLRSDSKQSKEVVVATTQLPTPPEKTVQSTPSRDYPIPPSRAHTREYDVPPPRDYAPPPSREYVPPTSREYPSPYAAPREYEASSREYIPPPAEYPTRGYPPSRDQLRSPMYPVDDAYYGKESQAPYGGR